MLVPDGDEGAGGMSPRRGWRFAIQGLSTKVAGNRFAKPSDEDLVRHLTLEQEILITIEEAAVGSLGAFVLHSLAHQGVLTGVSGSAR